MPHHDIIPFACLPIPKEGHICIVHVAKNDYYRLAHDVTTYCECNNFTGFTELLN